MKKIERIGDRVRVSTVNNQPTKTQKHHRDSVDVNNIMKSYGHRINKVPFLGTGAYRDLLNVPDYHGMQNQLISAQNAFMELPAAVRARFANDPQQLINFIDDAEKNYDEGVKLGIFKEKPAPEQKSAPEPKNAKHKNANNSSEGAKSSSADD